MNEGNPLARVAAVAARVFIGSVFVVFGLNGFFNFISVPPMPRDAVSFMSALAATGYMLPMVKLIEIIGGALVLSGTLTALGLLVLAPIVINILMFHVVLAPSGLPLPLALLVACLYLAWYNRQAYRPLFAGLLNDSDETAEGNETRAQIHL